MTAPYKPARIPALKELESEIMIHTPDSAGRAAEVIVAGDLCPVGRAERMILGGDRDTLLGDVKETLGRADLSIANLECPLTESKTPIAKIGPIFSAHPVCAGFIKDGGFDVVTLANNHVPDMGEVGIADTIDACRSAGLKTLGAGRNLEEACRPLFITVKSIRIAILAFAEQQFNWADSDTAGVWPLNVIDNYHQIQAAKAESDFILIILHGGNEGHPLPRPGLVKTARFFVDCGAHAVVCHHSHMPSGLEIYKNAPVVYGTGNFLFDWPEKRPKSWHTGYMVKLTIQSNAVTSLSLLPYCQFWHHHGIRALVDEERSLFFQEIERFSGITADFSRLENEWQTFCLLNRPPYLLDLFPISKVNRKLFQRFPSFFEYWLRSRRPELTLNLIRNDSHREALIKILSQEQ